MKGAQRNLFVPIATLRDWDEFNARLAEARRKENSHRIRGKEKTVGEALEDERAFFS